MLILKKSMDCSSHWTDLLSGQLRKNRQRQALFGCAFRFGKFALSITEISEAILLMQRERIINLSTNSDSLQVRSERIAMFSAYDKLMKNVSGRSAALQVRFYRQQEIRT